MTVGTCAKCSRVVQVSVDGLGRAWTEQHTTSGRGRCSGSGVPPRGYIPIKEE